MTEKRCDTCRHSIGYTRPEYVVCHVDGTCPKVMQGDNHCGAYEHGTDDPKERGQ